MSLFEKPRGKHAPGNQPDKTGAPSDAQTPLSPEQRAATVPVAASGAKENDASAEPASESLDWGSLSRDAEDRGEDESGKSDASGEPADESADSHDRAAQADSAQVSEAEALSAADDASDANGPSAEGDGGDEGDEGGVQPDGDAESPAAGFIAAGFSEIPSRKRRRGLKAFGITVGVLAAVALVVYIAGAIVFMGRFLPNTKVGEHDASLKTDAEVAAMLDSFVSEYQLDVIGGGFAYRAKGEGIGLTIDSAGIIAAMHEDENPWAWPALIFQPDHDETSRIYIDFDRSVYEGDVKAAIEKFNETARPPVDATITYDQKSDKFTVKPEEDGTQLDADVVLDAMAEAIEELDGKVALGEEHLLKPKVLSTDEKLIEAAELASGMVSARLSLVVGDQPVGEVNGDTLSDFITIGENYEVVFKEEELNAWADNLAAGYNTVGTERTYTRADGKQVSVPAGGTYGWEIDTEALKAAVLEGVKAGETATVDVPCIETAAAYNGVGQRDWGNRYLDVDLTEQHVRFYGDDGSIIWEDNFISGSPDGKHDTVPGTWYVNNKESPSKLIGYENGKKIYETSVTYWMPFEGNSIGFHDAPWQPGFGGSMYRNGYGSHGCVNLSSGAAKNLYGIIEVGDVVVVHF